MAGAYKSIGKQLSLYWAAYGRLRAILTSPYFHTAVLASVIMWPLWNSGSWWDIVLAVIPSLLSFSIAGFAMFVAVGDEQFRALMAGREDDDPPDQPSPFLLFAATFMHFIVVQVLALLIALVAKSTALVPPLPVWNMAWLSDGLRQPFWFIGFVVFAYALLTALATTVELFRLARIFDIFLRDKDADSDGADDGK